MPVTSSDGADGADDHALAASIATEAGRLLLEVRRRFVGDPDRLKAEGDLQSHHWIVGQLGALRPNDGLLSEEAAADPARLAFPRVWIVDPLDGTREFSLPGRDDWAVHVALWQRSSAADGGMITADGGMITDAAVARPALGEVHRSDRVTAPPPRPHPGPIRITASSNRPPPVLWRLRDRLDIEFVRIGSAGAKAMAVVRGDADAYIHDGGQWEWDSAAPAGVIQAAGLHATRIDGSPLRYNRPDPYLPDLLMCRPQVADLLLDAMWRVG